MYCDEICFLADQKGKGSTQPDVEGRTSPTKLKSQVKATTWVKMHVNFEGLANVFLTINLFEGFQSSSEKLW